MIAFSRLLITLNMILTPVLVHEHEEVGPMKPFIFERIASNLGEFCIEIGNKAIEITVLSEVEQSASEIMYLEFKKLCDME